MFYSLKIRSAILCPVVIRRYGSGTANALGRTISDVNREWKLLLHRMKGSGLSASEAAIVVAAWLAKYAPDDRKGFDIRGAMAFAAYALENDLVANSISGAPIAAVYAVMDSEGLLPSE